MQLTLIKAGEELLLLLLLKRNWISRVRKKSSGIGSISRLTGAKTRASLLQAWKHFAAPKIYIKIQVKSYHLTPPHSTPLYSTPWQWSCQPAQRASTHKQPKESEQTNLISVAATNDNKEQQQQQQQGPNFEVRPRPAFEYCPWTKKYPTGPPTCSGWHRPALPRASFHNQNTFVNLAELFLFYFTKSTPKKSCKVLAPPTTTMRTATSGKMVARSWHRIRNERDWEREEQWKQEEERPIFMFLCLANCKMNQRQSGPKPIAKQTDWHLCVRLRQRQHQRQRRLCRFRFGF